MPHNVGGRKEKWRKGGLPVVERCACVRLTQLLPLPPAHCFEYFASSFFLRSSFCRAEYVNYFARTAGMGRGTGKLVSGVSSVDKRACRDGMGKTTGHIASAECDDALVCARTLSMNAKNSCITFCSVALIL